MPKIVFFNHYHRGDIFTNRGYVNAIRTSLRNFEFGYLHFNHPKLTRDISIEYLGDPSFLNKKERFRQDDECLYVNTWIGAYKKIMNKHGGLNMKAMHEQWQIIFDEINRVFYTNLQLSSKKIRYMPGIDPSFLDLATVKNYVETTSSIKKILLCNGVPKSAQSFHYDMSQQINMLAEEFPDIHFICTTKIQSNFPNILFTDDIIRDTEEEIKRAPWEDRTLNICDLLEISYLSENCKIIIGKNSGPFCFCETLKNYSDNTKSFISFNVSWGIGTLETESMSYDLPLACKYTRIPISSVETLSDQDMQTIYSTIKQEILHL